MQTVVYSQPLLLWRIPATFSIVTTIVNETCGASNGSVTLGAVTGGVAPYTYSFDGSVTTATTSYTNLASLTYPIAGKDVKRLYILNLCYQ